MMRGSAVSLVICALMRACLVGAMDNDDPMRLELVQLGEGSEAIAQMAAEVNAHADAVEGVKILAQVSSGAAEREAAAEADTETEHVEASTGIMDATGHGFLLKDEHVYVSGSLRPRISKLAGSQQRQQSSEVVLRESQLDETAPHHQLAAFADWFGSQVTRSHRRKLANEPAASKIIRATDDVAEPNSHTLHQETNAPSIGPVTEVQALLQESLMMLQFSVEDHEARSPSETGNDESMLGEAGDDGDTKMNKKVEEQVKAVKKKEDGIVSAEEDKLEKEKAATDKAAGVKFKDTPNAKLYRSTGPKMAKKWDEAYTKPNVTIPPVASVPPEEKLQLVAVNISANMSEFVSDKVPGEKEGELLSWGVRRGAAKNFPVTPKLKMSKLAPLKDARGMDSFSIDGKHVGLVLHGNALSRVDGKPKVIAGSAAAGDTDGIGKKAKFNNPEDVAVFEDPEKKQSWMAIVADTGNDNLRVIHKLSGGDSKVTTALKQKMLLKPRRVAVLKSDPLEKNDTVKVIAFVVCGRRTIVRVENILGKNVTNGKKQAYETDKQAHITEKDNQIALMGNQPTVHIMSETDFEHISSIAAVSVQYGTNTRKLLFVADQSFKAVYRMDQIMYGELRANVAKMALVEHPGHLVVLGVSSTWFMLVADSRPETSTVQRVDNILDGENSAQVSSFPLHGGSNPKSVVGSEILKGHSFASLTGGSEWKGQLFGTLKGSSSSIVRLDLSVPLSCKEKTLLGSTMFQQLGELQDLGDVQTSDGAMYLYDWVAMSARKESSEWRVVNYFADSKQVCAVSVSGNSNRNSTTAAELLVPYYCESKYCWPL